MGLIYAGEDEGDKSLDLLKCLLLFRVLSDAEYLPRFSIVALGYTHILYSDHRLDNRKSPPNSAFAQRQLLRVVFTGACYLGSAVPSCTRCTKLVGLNALEFLGTGCPCC
jgi:hypothetical protein